MPDFLSQVERMINDLESKEKQKIARKYVEDMKWKGLRDPTIKSRMLSAVQFLKLVDDPKKITKEDVKKYANYLRDKKVSLNTLRLRLLNLKKFLEFLGYPDLLDGFKPPKVKNRLPVDNVLTPEDIKNMLKYAKTQRDRALLMLMWDSGARIGEITSLKIKNVEFDNYGGVVILPNKSDKLKTGQRRIRLIDSVPDLKLWLNMHPLKDKPEAPLFLSQLGRPLSDRQIDTILRQLAKKAKIKKDVSPHKIRHARLTFLAKMGLNEVELRIFAGWEDDSPMPAVYVHLAGGDVEKKLLRLAGIDIEEDKAEVKSLEPKICPRCGQKNPFDAKYCNCGQLLDVKEGITLQKEDVKSLEERIAKLEKEASLTKAVLRTMFEFFYGPRFLDPRKITNKERKILWKMITGEITLEEGKKMLQNVRVE